jgi:hypothetical protein
MEVRRLSSFRNVVLGWRRHGSVRGIGVKIDFDHFDQDSTFVMSIGEWSVLDASRCAACFADGGANGDDPGR